MIERTQWNWIKWNDKLHQVTGELAKTGEKYTTEDLWRWYGILRSVASHMLDKKMEMEK